MKKILLPIMIAGLALTGCRPSGVMHDCTTTLTILTPTGAPALAFYNYAGLENFETNSKPATIPPLMVSGSKDIIVLPTNLGVKTIVENEAPYKIAATISFGNFYLVSMGNDNDENGMDASDTILLFQKNNVPDKIFHYVYGNDLDAGIVYAADNGVAKQAIINGEYSDPDTGVKHIPNYVLIAEPALTDVKNKVTVYADMQAKYKEKSGNKEIFQASIFVKNSLSKDSVDGFLKCLEKDIDNAFKDPSEMSQKMNRDSTPEKTFGVAPETAEAVLRANNGMGLGFKKAKENKEAIETFLALFNLKDIDEKIYY